MVKAILGGKKTQTRRAVRIQYEHIQMTEYGWRGGKYVEAGVVCGEMDEIKCPYGKDGDLIWVKEKYYAYGMWIKNGHTKSGKQKWRFLDTTLTGYEYKYFDNPPDNVLPNTRREVFGWFRRSSLFMPFAASRIKLEITGVRVERLNEISNNDAKAEGINYVIDKVTGYCGYDYLSGGYNLMTTPWHGFSSLWQSINGKGTFDKRWVWVIEFKPKEEQP